MNNDIKFKDYKNQALKNPKVKAEYDKLQPEFELINAIIEARKRGGLTQTQLAQKIGTKQAVISRLEIGRANPTLEFLKRLAKALNSKLEIHLTTNRFDVFHPKLPAGRLTPRRKASGYTHADWSSRHPPDADRRNLSPQIPGCPVLL